MIRRIILGLVVLSSVMLMVTVGCSSIGRSLLFLPTHGSDGGGLTPWTRSGAFIGYSRIVDSPRNVWLMFHGNAGQASNRAYAIPSFPAEDSVFILEYPGYGNRAGAPSAAAFNQAAREAYLFLRESYPNIPVCIVGESIGSGPASSLAALSRPPDKLVLIVPFEKLSLVARDHFPAIVVSLLLRDDWDNIGALSGYRGPVDIFGAEDDNVIPVAHARALAAAVPSSKFFLIAGGHNDWSQQGRVKIRNP
jgi:pimeloyl-ACP methyl ester carboxylesterase